MIVQRLKTINGREYVIEVSNVGLHKWRAQIRRTPGGSSAMMPFYGTTPDEAAGQLTRWLAIANGQRRDPSAQGSDASNRGADEKTPLRS